MMRILRDSDLKKALGGIDNYEDLVEYAIEALKQIKIENGGLTEEMLENIQMQLDLKANRLKVPSEKRVNLTLLCRSRGII